MWGSGVFQPQHLVVQREKTGPVRLSRPEKVPTWVYTILQILSLTMFEKTLLNQLFDPDRPQLEPTEDPNQLNLFS